MALRRFAKPFTEDELAWITGEPAGTAARFRKSDQTILGYIQPSDPLALVLAYGVVREVRTESLDLATARWVVDPDFPAWQERCGDALLSSVHLGGVLILAYRFEFASRAARLAFEARVGTDVAIWDLWPRLADAAPALGDQVRFQGLVPLQQGGYPPPLIAPVADAKTLVACNAGADLRACAAVAASAIDYATSDRPDGFLAGIALSPAVLSFGLTPWSAVDARITPRALPEPVALARRDLYQRFEAAEAIARRVEAVSIFWAGAIDQGTREALRHGAEQNADVAAAALERCYDYTILGSAAAQDACVNGALLEALVARGYDPTLSYDALDLP